MTGHPPGLHDCRRGSVAIEFALLAPVFFAMLFGVLQVGLALKGYNALRGVSADVGRHVAVEYQNANRMTNEQIRLYGTATAVRAPYLLGSDRVTVSVAAAPVQRIAGAREMTFTIAYAVPNQLRFFAVPDVTVHFTRPIFVPV